MELFNAFFYILKRDLLLAYRFRSEIINPLLFFVVVVSLFPLAISPDTVLLTKIAPGIIWVAALLAVLLSLDYLFRSDFEDGTLEQFILSPHPLTALLIAKVIAHWLITALPLIIISPLLGMLLHLTSHAICILIVSLMIGTPTLSLVGAIGMALTVGLKQSGMLLALVVLPLYIPVLIFGASAVANASSGLPYGAQLALLGAFLLLTACLSPFAMAGALQASIE